MISDLDKLINYLNMGLSSHIVITGSERNIEQFQIDLKGRLESEGKSTRELLCTTEHLDLNQCKEVDSLLVKGLGDLPAQHNNSYAIRTYLDMGTYNKLRSIIFCETEHYTRHFNDYNAPFYQFCLHCPIGND
ncbi:hypothetical protein A3757_19820 [Oleiphilus sp. HI0117]|nr:hypothetical protein A3732_11015 [Oleiphilus sp. HI0050]KZZ33044.1 hypothetical protein A3757_19820 [Oleiphilus sp. HI0117]